MLRPTLDAILNEYVLMAITITIYYSMITNLCELKTYTSLKTRLIYFCHKEKHIFNDQEIFTRSDLEI